MERSYEIVARFRPGDDLTVWATYDSLEEANGVARSLVGECGRKDDLCGYDLMYVREAGAVRGKRMERKRAELIDAVIRDVAELRRSMSFAQFLQRECQGWIMPTPADDFVELLRSTARFKYGTTEAADLMLEAADMIERMDGDIGVAATMSNAVDLVKRLRERAEQAWEVYTRRADQELLCEAADMIERQEAEIKRLSAAPAA